MASSFKLGSLLIKTLSKPLANSLKRRAKQSPYFETFCIGLAQNYNKLDLTLKQNFLDYSSEIKPLSEARAVELGANFLAEIIIFSVGAMTIVAEAYRSSAKDKKSKSIVKMDILELEEGFALQKEQLGLLQSSVSQLELENKRLSDQVQELTVAVKDWTTRSHETMRVRPL
ncbi:hypothetical protein HDU91_006144 [Kappamyces sp. JEL0680]|nr:hypothetical protein HDU91_006144 [Kappamyces sp. JEL0680]